MQVSCKNLFDTLWHDKLLAHNKDPSAPRFGKTYFGEKRRLFARQSPFGELEPVAEEPIHEPLFEAVDQARSTPPHREKLLLFCRTSTHKPNQTETVGLIQFAFELNPTAVNYNLNVELARYLLRAQCQSSYER